MSLQGSRITHVLVYKRRPCSIWGEDCYTNFWLLWYTWNSEHLGRDTWHDGYVSLLRRHASGKSWYMAVTGVSCTYRDSFYTEFNVVNGTLSTLSIRSCLMRSITSLVWMVSCLATSCTSYWDPKPGQEMPAKRTHNARLTWARQLQKRVELGLKKEVQLKLP